MVQVIVQVVWQVSVVFPASQQADQAAEKDMPVVADADVEFEANAAAALSQLQQRKGH